MIDSSDAGRALRQIPRPDKEFVCQMCGTTFTAKQSQAKYCSGRCRQRAKYQRKKALQHP